METTPATSQHRMLDEIVANARLSALSSTRLCIQVDKLLDIVLVIRRKSKWTHKTIPAHFTTLFILAVSVTTLRIPVKAWTRTGSQQEKTLLQRNTYGQFRGRGPQCSTLANTRVVVACPIIDEKARVRHFVACACAQRLGRLVGLVAVAAIFRLHKIEVN